MNSDVLNGYVLAAVVLFAVLLYVAGVFMGFVELISNMPKRGIRRKRSKTGSADRRL